MSRLHSGFFAVLLLVGCSSPVLYQETETVTDTVITPQPSEITVERYAIRLNDTSLLSLQQWDSTGLGLNRAPVREKTRKLDENSDTFSGSYIKDVQYPGIKLQLFSPPQNGHHYWVQEIILTDSTYKTANHVTIGDPFEKVKAAYPDLQKFPGVNENMYYLSDSDAKSMEMEFAQNRLIRLRMYYMLN